MISIIYILNSVGIADEEIDRLFIMKGGTL